VTTHEERIRRSFSKQAFMSTLGAELTAVVQGGVEIRLPFSPNLTQQNSYLHAGAITAVLDSACGYAALTVAPDDKEVLTSVWTKIFVSSAPKSCPSTSFCAPNFSTNKSSISTIPLKSLTDDAGHCKTTWNFIAEERTRVLQGLQL
jgi:hypothetical protein